MSSHRKKHRHGVRAALRHGRAKISLRRRTRPGASPGTIRVDPEAPKPVLSVLAYGPTEFAEHRLERPEQLRSLLGKFPVVWLNVDGLGDAAVIEQIGAVFGLHRLALEDVVNVHQRAKAEEYGDHLFLVARMVSLPSRVTTEQLSMFLGTGFVVTFQEGMESDSLDPVRKRIRDRIGRIRDQGADYLAYAVLDAVIDHYYPVLEELGDRMETLEDRILDNGDPEALQKVHGLKRDLLLVRRAIWPHREMIGALVREPNSAIAEPTRLFLRDAHDHVAQILDLTETYREIASGLLDLYLNMVNSRINETMRVLTIIATIFIPLTFIVGVYGMNFKYMPELRWRWGYPAVLAVMALAALTMIGFFHVRGWLGRRPPASPADDDNTMP